MCVDYQRPEQSNSSKRIKIIIEYERHFYTSIFFLPSSPSEFARKNLRIPTSQEHQRRHHQHQPTATRRPACPSACLVVCVCGSLSPPRASLPAGGLDLGLAHSPPLFHKRLAAGEETPTDPPERHARRESHTAPPLYRSLSTLPPCRPKELGRLGLPASLVRRSPKSAGHQTLVDHRRRVSHRHRRGRPNQTTTWTRGRTETRTRRCRASR